MSATVTLARLPARTLRGLWWADNGHRVEQWVPAGVWIVTAVDPVDGVKAVRLSSPGLWAARHAGPVDQATADRLTRRGAYTVAHAMLYNLDGVLEHAICYPEGGWSAHAHLPGVGWVVNDEPSPELTAAVETIRAAVA